MTATPTEDFVRHPSYGVGKHRRGEGILRFFDHPGKDLVAVPVGSLELQPVVLERHQRVWHFDGSRWIAGFVDSFAPSLHAYLVDFAGGGADYVKTDQLYVRWALPLDNAVGFLQAGAVDARQIHDWRSDFVGNIIRQRAASCGLRGIWSSGIEVHAHQVGAARRVLADPVKRYLLADEVGLGKTVEAGMVLRQLLLDGSGDALVLAPDGLVKQWQAELVSKFRVDQFSGRVRIVPHSDVASIASTDWMLVVVDEAHRLTPPSVEAIDDRYCHLSKLAHAASNLLLLSATPVRSNEDGFLCMLHLLDPATYPLNGVAEFRRRVEIRDDLAEVLAALDDDTPLMFLSEPTALLRQLLPHEQWLRRELDALDGLIEQGEVEAVRDACRRVRVQIAETHRIHRRLVRTRRSASLAKLFPVRGRTVGRDWLLIDPDGRRQDVLRLLDDLRVDLTGLESADPMAVFRTVLGRAMAPVVALADLVMALRQEPGHDLDEGEATSLEGFAGTGLARSVAARIDEIVRQDTPSDRFAAMVEWVWPRVGSHRLAVACSFPGAANVAAQRLEAQFGSDRVVRLLSDMDAAARADALRRFANTTTGAVIVLDRSAEEGINLQLVEEVLHLDLPVSVARIEQRLGRFDRWAKRGSAVPAPVRSAVFREEDEEADAHLGGWRRAIDEGIGIFGESSATLQYVLPEVESEFLLTGLDEGLLVASERVAARRDDLDLQRRRIEGQDLLDAIEDRAEDQHVADSMKAADGASGILSKFRGYVVKNLGFSESVGTDSTRFGISTKHPPRVVESEVRKLGPENLRRRYAHRRPASTAGVGLLRWGEPLVDRFADLAMRDERGRSFAVELVHPRRQPGSILHFFMFSVVVTSDDAPMDELRCVDPAAASAAEVVVGQVFAPRLERVWWNPEHGEPPERTRQALNGADGKNLADDLGRFRYLTGAEWPSLCEQAAQQALGLIAQRPEVQQHQSGAALDAKAMRAREEAIVEARRHVGADASTDPRVFDAVLAAVEAPHLKIDSCGVVIVTGQST